MRNGITAVSLVIVVLPLAISGCCPNRQEKQEAAKRVYFHSTDFSEQWIYISPKIALIKQTKLEPADEAESISFSFVWGHYAGSPDYVWSSGNVIDGWLFSGVKRIALITNPFSNSEAILADTGVGLPSDPRFWLLDLQGTQSNSDNSISNLLSRAGMSAGTQIDWRGISLFFDTKRDSALPQVSKW